MKVAALLLLALVACGDDTTLAPDAAPEADAALDAMPDALVGVLGNQYPLFASNAEPEDRFGHAVAISADGTTVAVGAIGESSSGDPDTNDVEEAGAVYVFVREGAQWTQQAYLKPTVVNAMHFGESLALSADGSTLAIGAPYEDELEGAAYVFTRTGTTWAETGRVISPDRDTYSMAFGHSIALSGDGSLLVVGAPSFKSQTGVVNVFVNTAGQWRTDVSLRSSNLDHADNFGYALALDAAGTTLAVSAPNEASGATGVNGSQDDNGSLAAGAAYIFSRSASVWTQTEYIKASNTDAGDGFGTSVALSDDGAVLAVGATNERSASQTTPDDNSVLVAGAAYIYTRGPEHWAFDAYLKAAVPDNADYFGGRVALGAGGSLLVVTGFGMDDDRGVVGYFARGAAGWERKRDFRSIESEQGGTYGWSAVMAADGRTIVVGATNAFGQTGRAYVID